MRGTPNIRNARQSRQSMVPDSPGGRQSVAGSAVGRVASNQLPDYQPPAFSLNPQAQRALAVLVNQNGNLNKLDTRLSDAQAAISNAAGEINDRMSERKESQDKRNKRKRHHDGGSQENEEPESDDVQQDLTELQGKVDRMTDRMEESMRKMIDGRHAVKDIKESIAATAEDVRANASTQASTQMLRSQRRPRNGSDDEEDEAYQDFAPTDPTAGTQVQSAPIDAFRKRLDDAKTRYQSYSLAERYAKDNDYINFKNVVHDAQNHETGVPVPHARTWFAEEGEVPAPGVTTRAHDDDSDDDIAISRATISTKCPLTLQEFKNPLTSKKCNHSFEDHAILSMIRNSPTRGSVQCPCLGCQQTLTKDDLHTDLVLLRKIKRIQRAKELEEEDADDDDGDGRTQRNATLIDDDGDDVDGADVDKVIQRTQMKPEPKGTAPPPASSNAPPRSTAPIELGESSEEEEDEEE